eukprot:CAMPEP_0202968772 /NCGR_PEP_ID=MMETSP1396-20130829/14212_1 /ASSEMBLY_ACC=CAM_ASM_000872 /TAXON_ID= /ORGANISM="Pseudokeronopsis sp., Strain Brazil" /LENGTH=83 /DNA_ID=CAMNT_0049695473 /DNA_START=395 /DNA_END=646 /DNA_ORIENTATION=+
MDSNEKMSLNRKEPRPLNGSKQTQSEGSDFYLNDAGTAREDDSEIKKLKFERLFLMHTKGSRMSTYKNDPSKLEEAKHTSMNE